MTVGPRLVAIDLDGTLLDRRGRISERNRQAIARIRADGVRVVLVTARGFLRSRNYAWDLGLRLPIICCNGALIAESDTGRALYHRPLDASQALPILQYCLDHDLMVLVHLEHRYVPHPRTLELYPEHVAALAPLDSPTVDLHAALAGATFLRSVGRESVDAVRRQFEARCDGALRFVEMEWRGLPDLAIYHGSVSKGNALRQFCAERGIEQAAVMALGDHAADLAMFEAAGLRVAMGNADAALQAAADFVTATNDDDGVAVALDRFVPIARG